MSWLERAARPRVLRTAGLAVLLLAGAMQLLGAGLRTPTAPFGIVSLQLAGDVASATSIVDSWSRRAWSAGLVAHALDGLFPFAYGILLVGAAARLRARGAGGRTWMVAAGAAVLAAVADLVENVAMVPALLGLASTTSVQVTLVAAVVKFTVLAVALAVLVTLLLRARYGAARSAGGAAPEVDPHPEPRSHDL